MMVEQGMSGGGEGEKFQVQSSFAVNACQPAPSYHPYPPPLATYEDVLGSCELFLNTLKKLHASMGTKFMIPIVGGRDLDLHRLFEEVTSRGGIAKVVKDRKWKEVTAVFSFPSSATNASFILRKYYVSLLYHYEQIYFFKAKCWAPTPADAMQHLSTITAPPPSLPEYVPSVTQRTQMVSPQQQSNTATSVSEVSAGSPVCGVIDGKFDSGYLVTVKIGLEEFKGVLYQVPNNEVQMFPDHTQRESAKLNHSSAKPGVPRRKRRKKSEIRKRDPAHPKPNRSGYNFFFAEQHARLKPHYHGKDREISRIIGESWNKLQEPERAVYQEKALKDKERYKIEMEDYRERLRTGQIIRSAMPIQQQPPVPEANSTDLNSNLQFGGATPSAYTEENEMSSEKSDKSNLEEYESADKDSDFGEYPQADMELKTVNIEVMADEAFDLQTRPDRIGQDNKNPEHGAVDDDKMLSSTDNNMVLGEDGISVPIEEREQPPSNADESVPSL
ncbi:high mobility group B protein 15 [Sesamum indicum]|uniref:High mobility group B protein 15 n=1 Tax=Sesamum indicum TaxID=4182 RepID=A0A6I9TYT6_SESIN|nr:high mobility group B protein 15 [Sesamum indicum]